jgi:cell wall-associated NlpC family hydrolase
MPVIVTAILLAAVSPALAPSGQRAAASVLPMRVRALHWAEAQAGKPYIYGGTGPAGFDCSGLVMEAWLHGAGVRLPRTSYQIAADLSRLRIIPVADARRGDILVWPGASHVELKTRAANGSFGALQSGTRIGWHRWGGSWRPAFALALR